jgi:hypothetical protein
MGREVRKVPKGWQHPQTASGDFQPMRDEVFADAARKWLDHAIAWDNGTHARLVKGPDLKVQYPFFWQWAGNPPDPRYYRSAFTSEPTCFQYYENVSEGTPISPVFETSDGLVRWLVETERHTEKAARAFVRAGFAPSMVVGPFGIRMGVDVFDEVKR